MSLSSLIKDNTILIAIVLVGSYVIWKFVIQPIDNEGAPIEPTKEDIKTFGEKMQESMDPNIDI